MNKKSMLDVAFDIISEKDYSKNGIAFADLLEEIGRRLEMTEEELCKKASNFYTDLLRDGRFVTLGENTWDLRTRHKFEQVHIDMNELDAIDDNQQDYLIRLIDFLLTWLSNHILKADKQIGKYAATINQQP